jgi:hypothetical protein
LYHSTSGTLRDEVATARPKRRISISNGFPSSAAAARMPSTCSASCAAAMWRAKAIETGGAALMSRGS